MHPKIDKVQYIGSNGATSLRITGPIDDWENDEIQAVFSVVVSQITSDGKHVVIALGANPNSYPNGAGDWWSDATVETSVGGFNAGGALVSAWATIANEDGGAEMYGWALPVLLKVGTRPSADESA
jgi:hypothetical protein